MGDQDIDEEIIKADDLLSEELLNAIPPLEDVQATEDGHGPRDFLPGWREVNALLDAEAQEAAGPRLLFRLGRLVCNLPLNGDATEWLVGREGEHLDLALPHPSMSRRHFAIRKEGGEFCVRDVASRNGTFLNRHKVDLEGEAEVLTNTDVIYAGGQYFLFLDGEE